MYRISNLNRICIVYDSQNKYHQQNITSIISHEIISQGIISQKIISQGIISQEIILQGIISQYNNIAVYLYQNN